MSDREGTYRKIWDDIKRTFFNGFIVSERGLQAALYAEFREIPGVHVVVEPTWKVDGEKKTPDLVIVEKDKITDIFELKFKLKPKSKPTPTRTEVRFFKEDIQKLLQYVVKEKHYRVELDLPTGSRFSWPVRKDCRLHFVAVAHYNTPAVWPECLVAGVPELQNNPGRLNHWYGRVGDGRGENKKWDIDFGIR